jgi:ribosome-binding protein aMBF1 (putative translation factor)
LILFTAIAAKFAILTIGLTVEEESRRILLGHDIGKIVLFHRQKSGLSRNQLADLAGVGKTVIYDIEKGKETIRYATLTKVLKALNIKIVYSSPLMEVLNEKG